MDGKKWNYKDFNVYNPFNKKKEKNSTLKINKYNKYIFNLFYEKKNDNI